MTTEQRMYELFLDKLQDDLCQELLNKHLENRLIKCDINTLNSQKESLTLKVKEQDKTIETVIKDCQGFNRARLEAIEYNREVEQHVRNLFTALGTEIVRSDILTRLNKPKC